MEWTEELIAKLRELWSQGLSTAEIGRQLSITKNAVVGKAHRLELPPRPSPIRNRTSDGGAVSASRAKAGTSRRKKSTDDELPLEGGQNSRAAVEKQSPVVSDNIKNRSEGEMSSSSAVASKTAARDHGGMASKKRDEVKAADVDKLSGGEEPVGKPAASTRKMAPPRRVREFMDRSSRQGPSCQWPIGDPGTPGFHFCGGTPLPGKPYCAEHAAIAYVKIRDRRH